jgi:hypothetical protein
VPRLPKTPPLFFAGLQLSLCKLLYFTRFVERKRIIKLRYRCKIFIFKNVSDFILRIGAIRDTGAIRLGAVYRGPAQLDDRYAGHSWSGQLSETVNIR